MANQQQQVKGSAVHVATSHDDEQLCGGVHVPFDFRDMQTAADADLGDRFERALMRLEGLMYAVYGAIPDYHAGLQWWKSKNPRCLWPEQLSYDSPPPSGQGEDYWYHQLAAWGNYATYQGRGNFTTVSSTGYFDWGRSSTIAQQYHRTNHVTDWFPPGSVSMIGLGAYDDPQPGTDLRIVWTVPEGKRNKVASVKLVLAGTELTMASGDGGYTYIYTVSGGTLTHNDRTRSFYLKLVTNEAVPQTICDPYGATPPTAPTAFMPTDTWDSDHMPGDDQNAQAKGNGYWFVPFKHEAPYERGLPELLWKNYSGDKRTSLKRCTGTWQFKPWTNIKPGLINIARFCLDSLGEFFEQSPLLRGASPGCCFKHPIRFRWSGGNRPWLYRPGGKGGADGVHPITNLPSETDAGSHTARLSWRGSPALNMVYPVSNPMFGDDESWLPWPSTAPWVDRSERNEMTGKYTEQWADGYTDAKQYRGLREGDQIDRVHIEEIIHAVDAIIANGVWFIVKVSSCARTPIGCGPWGGGQYMSKEHYQVPDYDPPYSGYTYPYDDIGICPCQDRFLGPYNPPANIDDCRAASGTNVRSGYCPMLVRWQAWKGKEYDKYHTPQNTEWNGWHVECVSSCLSEYSTPPYTSLDDGPGFNDRGGCALGIDSFAYDPDNVNCIGQGCSDGQDFNWWDGSGEIVHNVETSRRCGATNGWSYYLCGPSKYWGGPGYDRWPNQTQRWDHIDTAHGNNFHKVRLYAYDDGTTLGRYQYVASMGNSAKRGYKCIGGTPQQITNWDSVETIEDYGPAFPWGAPQTSAGTCPMQDVNHNFPPIPGLGFYNPPDPNGNRTFMCRVAENHDIVWWDYDAGKMMSYGSTYTQKCCIKRDQSYYPNCAPDSQIKHPLYMEVDLNLDGNGLPTLHDYDLSIYQIGNASIHPDTPLAPDMINYQTGGWPYQCSDNPEVLLAAGGVQCPRGTGCGCT